MRVAVPCLALPCLALAWLRHLGHLPYPHRLGALPPISHLPPPLAPCPPPTAETRSLGACRRLGPGRILVRWLAPALECSIGQLPLGKALPCLPGRRVHWPFNQKLPTPVARLPCAGLARAPPGLFSHPAAASWGLLGLLGRTPVAPPRSQRTPPLVRVRAPGWPGCCPSPPPRKKRDAGAMARDGSFCTRRGILHRPTRPGCKTAQAPRSRCVASRAPACRHLACPELFFAGKPSTATKCVAGRPSRGRKLQPSTAAQHSQHKTAKQSTLLSTAQHSTHIHQCSVEQSRAEHSTATCCDPPAPSHTFAVRYIHALSAHCIPTLYRCHLPPIHARHPACSNIPPPLPVFHLRHHPDSPLFFSLALLRAPVIVSWPWTSRRAARPRGSPTRR